MGVPRRGPSHRGAEDDVTKLGAPPDANGNAVWDRVVVRVKLGDWDLGYVGQCRGEEGNTCGRQTSDIIDLTPDPSTMVPQTEVVFRLSDPQFSAPLRGGDRSFPPPAIADGSQDGHRNRFGQEEDGVLYYHVENAIKLDFLNNARLVSLGGKVPAPADGVQEFGL